MKTLSTLDLDRPSAQAEASPRLRANHNFHPDLAAPVHRLAIAMQPDTYVRPHRHVQSWELLTVLRGKFEVVIFDAAGQQIAERVVLAADHTTTLEMPAGTWHSVVSCQSGSVIFEVKLGPYQPLTEADLAPWSPAEGEATVPAMLTFLRQGAVGAGWAG